MSRVVFFSLPFYSHVNPTLKLAEELVQRGEEVFYFTSDALRYKVESTGVTFKSYGNVVSFVNHEEETKDLFNNRPAELLTYLFKTVIIKSKEMVDEVIKEVIQIEPDYIIRDTDAFWGRQIGKLLDIPVVSYILTFAINEDIVNSNVKFFVENVLRMPDATLEKGNFTSYSEALNSLANRVAHTYGFEDFKCLDAFTGNEELNIVYTSRAFQPYEDTFSNRYEFIGPNIQAQTKMIEFPFERLQDKPLVYISFGTIFNHKMGFYTKCLETFRDTEYQVVLSLGDKSKLELLENIPDNFIVRDFVPQIEILQRADVFISHAGYNSVCEAFYYHTPLVVFPQGADQFAIACRIEELGAGIYVRDMEIDPGDLKKIVDQVYRDENYRIKGKIIGDSFRASGGVPKAVDTIFSYKRSKGILD